MRLEIPRILAYAPSGRGEPALVVAAGRAGGLGVLDFGFDFRAREAMASAREAARYSDRPLGLRLRAGDFRASLLRDAPENLRVVVASDPLDEDWSRLESEARSLEIGLLVEVSTRQAARRAQELACEGIVLAGLEAGGRGSEETSLILLQATLRTGATACWVRGGMGLHSSASAVAAGARGVVLDGALLMAKESPLSIDERAVVGRLDGSETSVVTDAEGRSVRVFLPRSGPKPDGPISTRESVGFEPGRIWPMGQDAAFAASLAARFGTVGGIVQAVERSIDESLTAANRNRPLAEGSPLSQDHGTRYPVVQGPMTRVSDTSAFAEAVAKEGALPFLALALAKGDACRTLMHETARRLEGRSWGVGILGFAPPEVRAEQLGAIREVRPPFALIAGGRPDQARRLEGDGIRTYLHAPSPGLLRQFLREGARRFVLEGRECGGHVGPRTSLVLWDQAVGVVEEALREGVEADSIHLLFAGGLHDSASAASVATVAGPLVDRGVKIGMLVGTAYLFTREAIESGAIVPGYQDEALRCERTVLLETGPGHEVRVCPSPFWTHFETERRRLAASGLTFEQVRETLERLNTGRLRVAAKGLDRVGGPDSPLEAVSVDDQRERGVYMIGQVATLRDETTTIASLHQALCEESVGWLAQRVAMMEVSSEIAPMPSDIAIVGMAALMPGAASVRAFWQNTLKGVDAIEEIPKDRWDWRAYYDPDPKAPDKIVSKWGGFVPEVPFDPIRYGMPPSSVPSIEPLQLLTLEVVRAALSDAGYQDRPFPRERTAVVLGAGGGASQLAMGYAFRSYLPLLESAMEGLGVEALDRARGLLPEWTEDAFPGILLNVAAGRVANRFNLGGSNYTVDAACGSSLAAAAVAVRELESKAADVVILGGVDTVQNPFTYLAFSKTHAFSPRGRCRPFDVSADGIVISEGVAALVLKRLSDAERDGDRIYAVIKGIGSSSDGRAKGLTAPRPEGQVMALERAYARAGISPASVGYVEAHGTGTSAGDLAEVGALVDVFQAAGARPRACALGSVKSLVGHTKCAAGLAGLINASLALHHKVLPTTIGVRTPNPKISLVDGPFHLSTSARPWLKAGRTEPRRAGVSAFGFGGTNFHAVLEEYDRDPTPSSSACEEWPAELLVWVAENVSTLETDLATLEAVLRSENPPSIRDLAAALASRARPARGGWRMAMVASSLEDVLIKLGRGLSAIRSGSSGLTDPSGLWMSSGSESGVGRLAFLFPGQGSQAPDMLGDLGLYFPEIREGFDAFDAELCREGGTAIGPRIFSAPAFDVEGRDARRQLLRETEIAQTALGAATLAAVRLVQGFGLVPSAVAGHSFGELSALFMAGFLSARSFAKLSAYRGRLMGEAVRAAETGGMVAFVASPERVTTLLMGIEGTTIANLNGPLQTVVSGPSKGLEEALQRARASGIRGVLLNVGGAFHTEAVASVCEPLAHLTREHLSGPPIASVYSNASASLYPADMRLIAAQVGNQVVQPVRFSEMIEAMHADGLRTFLEVGPGSTLTALVGSVLGDRPHRALAMEPAGKPGLLGWLSTLGSLFVAGQTPNLDRLFAGRNVRRLDPGKWTPIEADERISESTWMVNGARARPLKGGPPQILGASIDPKIRPDRRPKREPMPNPGSHRVANLRPDAAEAPIPRPHHRDEAASQVVHAFQKTMCAFLETQREAMLGYFRGVPASAPAYVLDNTTQSLPTAFVEKGKSEPLAVDQPSMPVPSAKVAEDDRSLTDLLRRLVHERTGYPMEMLGTDLDLEADLGIDSIKRVEILGSLRDARPDLNLSSDGQVMDDLSRARTLGQIIGFLERSSTNPAIEQKTFAGGSGPEASQRAVSEIRRMVLEVVPAPLPSGRASLKSGGCVLITEDDLGVARDVAADLRALGYPVVRVRHGVSDSDVEGLNLTSEASVSALLERIRVRGPLAAIIHLLPLRSRPSEGLDPDAWQRRLEPELKGLFLLAKYAADDLEQSARTGGACLLALTQMGGTFASAGFAPASFFPGQGGLSGLVKTLGHEWPGVRTRTVDIEPSADIEVLAADVVKELFTPDPRVEVGYRFHVRQAISTVESPLDKESANPVEIREGEPIVVSGGARGITAEVVKDLADRYRPTLLILGSGPEPSEEEDPATEGLETAAELKQFIMNRLRSTRNHVEPAEVERVYHNLRREREARRNLRRLRETGAIVRYARVDVRDADSLGQVLTAWKDEFGSPVGLIHAAGVIKDKLLRAKSLESFDLVFATKFQGALNLAHGLDPRKLRFSVFFSSVAGRFGNRGQSDYAAANEALNKLALWLDSRWPGRVISMIWGPWSGVGMVSEIERHLGSRGLTLISPEQGRTRMLDELLRGRKGEVEVVIAGDVRSLEHPFLRDGEGCS